MYISSRFCKKIKIEVDIITSCSIFCDLSLTLTKSHKTHMIDTEKYIYTKN